MVKIQILTRCETCDGEAYLPVGEEVSNKGELYTRYRPCPMCQGSGNQTCWITLREFVDLFNEEAAKDPLEPDWLELAHRQPVGQYQDSQDAAGIRDKQPSIYPGQSLEEEAALSISTPKELLK